ncbi:MAG: WbqC family protein [Roseovarius pacificus]|nr:WbqC family protein [Roseovarius pacificus]
MQPYLFPYIGYFQLAAAVDEFWLLDTVQFIQQGWMNRNNLLINGHKTMFSIPVNKRPRIDLISNKAYGPTAARDCEKSCWRLFGKPTPRPPTPTMPCVLSRISLDTLHTPPNPRTSRKRPNTPCISALTRSG